MTDPASAVVDTVAEAIAQIDPGHLNDREVVAFLAGISETTTGLLQAKPDLKAHADLVMDLANRAFHASRAAEARGFRSAAESLRDEGTLLTWWQAQTPDTHLDMATVARLADYLESFAEEAPDGE